MGVLKPLIFCLAGLVVPFSFSEFKGAAVDLKLLIRGQRNAAVDVAPLSLEETKSAGEEVLYSNKVVARKQGGCNIAAWRNQTHHEDNISPDLEKFCVSNKNLTALKLHPLYAKAQFLMQKRMDVDTDDEMYIQGQYENILNFIREKDLTKVIVYGLRDATTHPHSRVHHGWFRAWIDILIQVANLPCGTPLTLCWIDANDNVPKDVWENSFLFGSYGEGIQAYSDMEPIVQVNSSLQVWHYNAFPSWHPLPPNAHHWYRPQGRDSVEADKANNKLPTRGFFLDWATDLVPTEIEANRPVQQRMSAAMMAYRTTAGIQQQRVSSAVMSQQRNNNNPAGIVFCGTIWDQNVGELQLISRVAAENLQLPFHHYGAVQLQNRTLFGSTYMNHPGWISHRDEYQILHDSFLAPAIQGLGSLEQGHVPRRIFQSISAGKLGISNNQAVSKLFPRDTVLVRHGASRQAVQQLLQEAVGLSSDRNGASLALQINKAMTTVQMEHTYLARFNDVVDFIRKRR